jgi:hypothetical protein
MRPFPAELMRMWPISRRVNKPENDDPSIVEPIELTEGAGSQTASAVTPTGLFAKSRKEAATASNF